MDEDEIFHTMSDEVKDLIRGLLEVNSEERMSVKQAKSHKWFKKKHSDRVTIKKKSVDFNEFI